MKKNVLLLIGIIGLCTAFAGCGSNKVQTNIENNLDINKIYLFSSENIEEVMPASENFAELSDEINNLLSDIPANIFSGVDGRISLDGGDSNVVGDEETVHVKVLFSTPVVVKDTRGVSYNVTMIYFEDPQIMYIFDGDYSKTIEAVNAFGLDKPWTEYLKIDAL
jgi:hypothetical protein